MYMFNVPEVGGNGRGVFQVRGQSHAWDCRVLPGDEKLYLVNKIYPVIKKKVFEVRGQSHAWDCRVLLGNKKKVSCK